MYNFAAAISLLTFFDSEMSAREERFTGHSGNAAGVPDGFFSNQFGKILEGPRLEIVDIFYGHLEYFTAIWGIL
jgi:hypothetical protein